MREERLMSWRHLVFKFFALDNVFLDAYDYAANNKNHDA
jgi:hypothetical protein